AAGRNADRPSKSSQKARASPRPVTSTCCPHGSSNSPTASRRTEAGRLRAGKKAMLGQPVEGTISMLIVAPCPCGKQLRANESLIGQTIQCNLCRRFVPVPDPTAVPEAPKGPVEEPPPPAGSPREYFYWLLALAFFPLAFSLSEKHERLDKRF